MIRAATLTPILGAILGCFATQANATYWYYGAQDDRPLKFYEAAAQYCEANVAHLNSLNSAPGWLYVLRSVEIEDPELFGICLIRWIPPSVPDGFGVPVTVSIVDCKDPHSLPHDEGVSRLASCSCSRSYDTAGRLVATEFGSYVYDSAGRMTSLMQQLLQPADADRRTAPSPVPTRTGM